MAANILRVKQIATSVGMNVCVFLAIFSCPEYRIVQQYFSECTPGGSLVISFAIKGLLL